MLPTLLFDRFLTRDGMCRDLATGRAVELTWADGMERMDGMDGMVPMDQMDLDVAGTWRAEAASTWINGRRRLLGTGLSDGRRVDVWSAPLAEARLFAIRHLTRPVVRAVVERIEAHTDPGINTISLAVCAEAGTQSVLSDVADALRDLGFVAISSAFDFNDFSAEERKRLCHRHVVLIRGIRRDSDDDEGRIAEWQRALSVASARSQTVLALERSGERGRTASSSLGITPFGVDQLIETFQAGEWRPPRDVVVRAARASGGWPRAFARLLTTACSLTATADAQRIVRDGRRVDAHLARASSCARRGRAAASARWCRVALHSALRRKDDGRAALAVEQLADGGRVSEWARVGGRSRRRLNMRSQIDAMIASPGDPCAKARIAAAGARLALAAGDLRKAETLSNLAEAEAALGGRPLPRSHLACRAELRLWQGRAQLGLHELAQYGDDPLAVLWRSWLGWCRGKAPDIRLIPECAESWDVRTRLWHSGLAAIATGDPCLVDRVARAHALWPLQRALLAEVHLGAREAGRALRVLGRSSGFRVVPGVAAGSSVGRSPDRPRHVWDLLNDWLRAACERGSEHRARGFDREINRLQAAGVRYWAQRRSVMDMHDVSALFDIVHETDEGQIGMERAVGWARDASKASVIAVCDANTGVVLAGDRRTVVIDRARDEGAWHACVETGKPVTIHAGGETSGWAPVRYGGVTIGVAFGRGPSDLCSGLPDTLVALGAALAPWVRERLDAAQVVQSGAGLTSVIIGASAAMAAVREAAVRAAATPFPVLIEGESGTGKELVARAVHQLGPRRDRRMCALNCAALTDDLLEAELFGHTRGAFTGAMTTRTGLFEEAHQSTLFLDEVADLSPRAQAKLLRVLQEGEIRRLGENATRRVDVRVVSATNKPLRLAARAGTFRDDLHFRLAVIRICVPPLRERQEDIPVLAQVFWKDAARRAGSHAHLGPDALSALSRCAWPGNVRQLQNAIAGLVVNAPLRGRVSARHVALVLDAQGVGPAMAEMPLGAARHRAERQAVAGALARHAGCRQTAARELGLSRQGLTKAIRRLGLRRPDAAGVA